MIKFRNFIGGRGRGIRGCLGRAFGVSEIKVLIPQKFPGFISFGSAPQASAVAGAHYRRIERRNIAYGVG